jgi:hypothetical protein
MQAHQLRPFDAPDIANHAIANIHSINKSILHFFAVTYRKLLVDGWCLQVRFGYSKAICLLCQDGLDSMRHMAHCPVAWEIRHSSPGRPRIRALPPSMESLPTNLSCCDTLCFWMYCEKPLTVFAQASLLSARSTSLERDTNSLSGPFHRFVSLLFHSIKYMFHQVCSPCCLLVSSFSAFPPSRPLSS